MSGSCMQGFILSTKQIYLSDIIKCKQTSLEKNSRALLEKVKELCLIFYEFVTGKSWITT